MSEEMDISLNSKYLRPMQTPLLSGGSMKSASSLYCCKPLQWAMALGNAARGKTNS